jgi:hypothetical protein
VKKRHRFAIAKLLVLSLLFFQFALAFHTHDAAESVHCDACVTTLADHQSGSLADECALGAFYHTAFAPLFADETAPVADLTPFSPHFAYRGHHTLFSSTLPLGSRAPPAI